MNIHTAELQRRELSRRGLAPCGALAPVGRVNVHTRPACGALTPAHRATSRACAAHASQLRAANLLARGLLERLDEGEQVRREEATDERPVDEREDEEQDMEKLRLARVARVGRTKLSLRRDERGALMCGDLLQLADDDSLLLPTALLLA